MALLDILGSRVQSAVGSLTLGTNLFLSEMPPDPDLAVAILETPGGPPTYSFSGGGDTSTRPLQLTGRAQVMVRGAVDDYQTPRDLAEDVLSALEQTAANTTIDGVKVARIERLNGPFPSGRDGNDRKVIVGNVQVIYDGAGAAL